MVDIEPREFVVSVVLNYLFLSVKILLQNMVKLAAVHVAEVRVSLVVDHVVRASPVAVLEAERNIERLAVNTINLMVVDAI
jgi:hypothetical protein